MAEGTKKGARRLARERALQYLYGLDFTGRPWEEGIEYFWANNPARPSVRQYADRLISHVCMRREELDSAIDAALDHWTPDRVGRIERNVLRIALEEIAHGGVPPTAAINEAIEVAKRFGAEEAPRFVNGVLDRLVRQLPPKASGGNA